MTVKFGPIGYITYKRTYARPLDNGNTEEFVQAMDQRIIPAIRDQLHLPVDDHELIRLKQYFRDMKCSLAGRFLWQLGTKTVDKLGLMSLQNCAATVVNDPIEPFCWAMDALMLGSGVGYNIQREFVYELPKPKAVTVTRLDTNDADFIVPDSREGWVELLRRVLTAHYVTGKGFTYSTICVRGKGTAIKGFGGVASGPEELCWGMEQISKVINARAKKKMRPIDCLDIMNIIGYVVVAGNVRRSAQIAIGDVDDMQFLQAKRWDLGNVPNWRAMSNNSVVCSDVTHLNKTFWEGYEGKGEPYGIINLKMAQTQGRTGETQYPDKKAVIFNPCVEQPLEPYETCCLAEVFLPNVTSEAEFRDIVTLLYKVCKQSLTLPCHQAKTEKVVHRNMRMGIGVTGFMQATKEQHGWLSPTYTYLRDFDQKWSAVQGLPTSIKLTTVKPSGTLSLLAGVTAGCHPGYSQYYIRRIRMSANSPLVQTCRDHGYAVEPQQNFDGTLDHNTVVVSFPCSHPAGTVLAKDVSAVQQLETVKWLQANWSDNGVSCTIYYTKEELPAIQEWLQENFATSIKACSFLLRNDHGFVQAPYEEITEAQYNDMLSKVKPITSVDGQFTDELSDCEGGACPVR